MERRASTAVFVGLVAEDIFAAGPQFRNCILSKLAKGGLGILRQTFSWASIERQRGRYDLSYYDEYVSTAARHGIQILPILFDTPGFRARRGSRRGAYPPRRNQDMARFAQVLVRRYGPRGTLWRSRPGVPKLPIRAWQIWNEPNLPVYWPTGPDAREYTAMLKAVSRAIRRIDRRAEIVTAGLPASTQGVPLRRFLTAMFRAGAGRSFSSVAVNPYAGTTSGVMRTVKMVRRLMSLGGHKGAIWVTEIGWASQGPPSKFNVGESGQSARITSTYRTMARMRKRLGIRGVVYFNLRDAEPYPGGRDFWGLHTGLLRRDGAEKSAFSAFMTAAGQTGSLR